MFLSSSSGKMIHSLNSFTKRRYSGLHSQVPQTALGMGQKTAPPCPSPEWTFHLEWMELKALLSGNLWLFGSSNLYVLLALQPLIMKNVLFPLEVLGYAKVLFSLFPHVCSMRKEGTMTADSWVSPCQVLRGDKTELFWLCMCHFFTSCGSRATCHFLWEIRQNSR